MAATEDETTTGVAFTGKPGDTFTFNGATVTILAGVVKLAISARGKIDRGVRPGLSSRNSRRPRRLRRAD